MYVYIHIHLDESWPRCDVRWMMVRIVGNHPQMTLFEISALLWFIQIQCMHMRYILLFLFPRITLYFRFVIYSIFSNLLRCLGMFPWVFRQCWFFFASQNVEPLVAFFAFQKSRNLAHLRGGDRGLKVPSLAVAADSMVPLPKVPLAEFLFKMHESSLPPTFCYFCL